MGLLDTLGGLAGSIAAKQIQDDSFTSQQQNLQHIYDQIRKIPLPDEQKLQILLSLPEVAGQLSPQQLSSISLGKTELENLPANSEAKDAQLSALKQLQGLSQTGLTPADLAAMRQLQQQTEAQQQSNNAGIIQQMAQRGKGGGGSELALRAANAQQATNRLSNQSDQIAQMAQARALHALSSVGNQASSMRGQDYQESLNRASAVDAINRYNTMNQQNVAQQNNQNNNMAQQFNLQNAQNVANKRTDTQNQQQTYNAQIPQMLYQDQLLKYQAMGTPAAGLAKIEGDRGKADSGYALGMGQAGGGLLSNLAGMAMKMNEGGEVPCYEEGGMVSDPEPMAKAPKKEDADDLFPDIISQLAPLAMMAFAKTGGVVPGMPKVKGNSIKNDIVPVMASPGEIFIPRSHSENLEKSMQFLEHIFKNRAG